MMPCEQILLDGTVRARTPEETWQLLAPVLRPRYGITRIADLTGLDYLGLPAFTAIRPASHTLTATQGKGATGLLARISAAMEAIELWHSEQPLPVHAYGSHRQIAPPYPFDALPVKTPGEGLDRVVLEWTIATGLSSGVGVPVPVDVIRRSARPPLWRPDILRATSTGLACGNTLPEAALHAMYEVVERASLFADELADGGHRTRIDPASVEDPYCVSLIGRLHEAGVALELVHVGNAFDIPVCTAYLWSEDYPLWFAGGGCHSDPNIALSRAVTEAVQSRLTCIAGTRDDLPVDEAVFATSVTPPAASAGGQPWGSLASAYPAWNGGFSDQVGEVAARFRQVTGYEPLCVDLTQPGEPLFAVKTICPGTRSRIRRSIPR